MADNPRYHDDDRFGVDVPERKRSTFSTCLTGCLIGFVVIVILALIAGIWVWRNWRDWAATLGEQAIHEMMAEAKLPEVEQKEIKEQVERVTDAFRAGKLTGDQMAELVRNISKSPLMTSIIASAVDSNYIAKSGLNDEEKAAARQTIRRFLRGVVDQKIKEQSIDAAMAHVAVRDGDGSWKLKDQVSDDELRKFLEVAKAEADKAEIPEEPEDFDPSEELKRIVDEALK